MTWTFDCWNGIKQLRCKRTQEEAEQMLIETIEQWLADMESAT
jgi:hypothetical protein